MKKVMNKIVNVYGAGFAWVFFMAMAINGGFNNMFSNPVNAVLTIATILAFAASFTSVVISVVQFIKRRPLRRLRNVAEDLIGTYRSVKSRRKEVVS